MPQVDVRGYSNNCPRAKPRKPLVHIMASDTGCELQSFSFHPKHAAEVAEAILAAGRSAARGRKFARQIETSDG